LIFTLEYHGFLQRETGMQRDGELCPEKKGIMLSAADWAALGPELPRLLHALQQQDLSVEVSLSGTKRATVSSFRKDTLTVDVREWYEKDCELKPGQKGLALPQPAVEILAAKASDISAALGESRRPSAPAATAAPTTGSSAANTGPTSASTERDAEVSGTGQTIWRLGGNKFASVSDYKGRCSVDMREYYQKDGKWMPGKKGIALTVEQFQVLQEHAEVRRFYDLADSNTLQAGRKKVRVGE
jgi:hypothetical protein